MINVLLDFFRGVSVYGMYLAKVTIQDDSSGDLITFHFPEIEHRVVSVRQIVSYASANLTPFVFIDVGDHQ